MKDSIVYDAGKIYPHTVPGMGRVGHNEPADHYSYYATDHRRNVAHWLNPADAEQQAKQAGSFNADYPVFAGWKSMVLNQVIEFIDNGPPESDDDRLEYTCTNYVCWFPVWNRDYAAESRRFLDMMRERWNRA